MDVLRSIHKSKGQVLDAFSSSVMSKISQAENNRSLKSAFDSVHTAVNHLMSSQHVDDLLQPVAARDFAYSLARIYIGIV